MKSLSTVDRTDKVKQKLKSSNCHSYTRMYYTDDYGIDKIIDDLQYPIKVKKYSEPPKYANIAYNPAASEISFNVINRDGIYSPKNTDSAFYDVFKRDRIVKLYDGKYLQSLAAETSETLYLGDAFLYYTKFVNSSAGTPESIVLDINNTAAETDIYFTDLFPLYGSCHYGDDYYAEDGYALWKVDLETQFAEKLTKIVVNANATGADIYYKLGNDTDAMNVLGTSTGWINGGSTINGDTTVTINHSRFRYVWIAIIFKTYDWDSTLQINSVAYYYQSHVEWTLLGTFYLDDPDFQDRHIPELSIVACNGRNAYKKALETKVNIADVSGDSLDEIIKALCDLCSITYTATSIADLSSYGVRTLTAGYEDEVTVDKLFEDIMLIVGYTYRMYIDDENVLYVQARPVTYVADWVFSYRRYKEAQQKFVGEKQLQRFGIMNENQVLSAVTLLSTDTFLATGAQTATWVGDAIAKYWTITVNAGDGTIESVTMTPTTAVYTLGGSVVNVTIKTYGCKFGTSPDYLGEAVNSDNMTNNDGFMSRVINPLVISDAECKTISENVIAEFGNPTFDIELTDCYLNPLVEMNDQVVLLSENVFEDSLFEVTGIEYNITSETEKNSGFFLMDTGRNWNDTGAIVWDRDLYNSATAWKFDSGLFYDSKYRVGVTEAEILAATTYHHDSDFN